MHKTTLGGTDLSVSRLCLGTMTWGSQNTEAEAHAQIDRAAAAGVNFIDTAELYPVNPMRAETVGRTEEIIGNWNARTGRRGDWVIATKIGGEGSKTRGGEEITPASIRAALEASLRRLKTDHVDLYQFHWPNRGSYHFRKCWAFDPSKQDRAAILANMADCLDTLAAVQKEGKIRHWGLSNESAWGMANWLALAENTGTPRPASIQNEYSLLCRAYDTDLAELGHNEKVTLLAFSPLAAGLLTGKYAGDVIPENSRRSLNETLGGRITPRVWEAVSAYLGIAARAGLDPVQMALAWALSRPFPVIPIFGATRPEHLDLALGAAEMILPPEVLGEINAAHKAHPMP
ncbi:MAG: aldo/keto reductase, partial [Albidovulum sp.]